MADAPSNSGRDYRETLFLPELPGDPFPMRAGLPKKEPERVAYWAQIGLYNLLRKDAAARPKFILHDGPPYANGAIHIGHAENKILKDIVVRTKQMTGFDCDYVPGWDCHGLPIEWKVEEDFRKAGRKKQDVPAVEFRKACREYADKWIPLQKQEFQRLGIEGDWDRYYATMSYAAEAAIAAEFLRVAKTGLVYRGSKPVMWSPVERTSLAEAEVEYAEKTSPTIWVKFPIFWEQGSWQPDTTLRTHLLGANVVIWTTTPWTIPGNRAISYNPNIKYVLFEVEEVEAGGAFEPWAKVGERLILSEQRAADVFNAAKIVRARPLGQVNPEGLRAHHPLRGKGYEFPVPLLAGEHVTDDAGTGFVHTAPGHGADDFEIWVKNFGQQDIPFTVNEEGKFLPARYDADGKLVGGAPGFEGLEIIQLEGKNTGKDGPANKAVIDKLIEVGALLARGQLKHSYPHSWRSHAPLIFRNTPQWFIALDKPYDAGGGRTLRRVALGEIERVDWGQRRLNDDRDQNRIKAMIEERPDWLISRQRNWGVPLAIFVSKADASILRDDEVDARVIAAMKQGGADVWWSTPAQDLLGAKYKAEDYEKVEDILDVWFDSGSTHAFVLGERDKPTRPSFLNPQSVLYLEGSDQHRGWFHSSLLESCATRGRAPYDEVITYGFTVAEDGRKMSKSLGNGVEPQQLEKEYGIEPFRLLIAAADYRDELRLGPTILAQATEMYRKLRNTIRYCLGALKDFDENERLWPANSPVPRAVVAMKGSEDLPLLERWLLHRLWQLDGVVREAYKTYQFRAALSIIVEFCNVDLSAFYLDVRKDALYCDAPNSIRRRACRSALDEVFARLTVWLAPILPFTTEEAWLTRYPNEKSVHLRQFPETPAAWEDALADQNFGVFRFFRRGMTAALEKAREAKLIGASLEAKLHIFATDAERAVFGWCAEQSGVSVEEFISENVIVSAAELHPIGAAPPGAFHPDLDIGGGFAIVVEKASGVKCARSWKYFDPLTAYRKYPDITPRDADAVAAWDAAHDRT
jgi:isoleucyl-tRNA synthetase